MRSVAMARAQVGRGQSADNPARRMTEAQRSRSLAMTDAKSSELPPTGGHALRLQLLLGGGQAQPFVERRPQRLPHGGGQAGGTEHAVPKVHLRAGEARFGHGRDVRHRGRPLRAAHRQQADVVRRREGNGGVHRQHHGRHAAGDEVLYRRGAAAVRDVVHPDIRDQAEQLHAEVLRRAVARAGVVQGGGGARQRRQGAGVRGGHAGVDGEHEVAARQADDRGKAADRIIGHLLEQARVHDEGVGLEQQGAAIGRGAGHRLGADVAGSAGAVLDHEGLGEAGLEKGRDQPGEDVHAGAGRERDQDGDRAFGALRPRDARRSRRQGERDQAPAIHHASNPRCPAAPPSCLHLLLGWWIGATEMHAEGVPRLTRRVPHGDIGRDRDPMEERRAMSLLASLEGRLSLPAIAAPLFIISVPDLVVAQCTAGVVGSMPS